MELLDVLDEKIIVLDLEAKDKNDVLVKMSNVLASHHYIDDEVSFLKDIYVREEEGITGIGNGVAIPHGKSMSVKNLGVAIAKLAKPVKWESLDDGDVDLVFLFCVSDDKDFNINHMRLLSKIAGKLADDDLLLEIKNCTDPGQVKNLLV